MPAAPSKRNGTPHQYWFQAAAETVANLKAQLLAREITHDRLQALEVRIRALEHRVLGPPPEPPPPPRRTGRRGGYQPPRLPGTLPQIDTPTFADPYVDNPRKDADHDGSA